MFYSVRGFGAARAVTSSRSRGTGGGPAESAPEFSGTIYYVSTSDGSDSDNGLTQATAWQTITKVNAQSFSPGDAILFKRGDSWVSSTTALVVPSSGTSGNPITFGAYGSGAKPKIDGDGGTHGGYGCVQCDGKNYITFDGLEVTNAARDTFTITSGSASVTGIIVRNCEVHNNVDAYSLFGIQNFVTGTNTPQAEGRITNCLVENNIFHDAGHNTLMVNGGVTNTIVRYNTIYNATHNGIDVKSVNSTTAYNRGIQLIGNTVYDCETGIFFADTADGLLDGNTVRNCVDLIKSYVWQATDGGGGGPSKNSNNTFQRNILYQTGAFALTGVAEWLNDTNVLKMYNNSIWNCNLAFYNTGNTSVTRTNDLAYGNTSGDTPGGNPNWVNPAAGDFHLSVGSFAIDAGSNVGLPYNGSAPDLGAVES